MPVLETKIDTQSELFGSNRSHFADLIQTHRERQRWVIEGDRQKSIDRHLSRGKIMVRDRIDLVVDPHSPFLELSTLAAYNLYENQSPGAGMVTGIGIVHGTPCMFIANDATVKGGTLFPVSIKKQIRAMDIAAENNLPVIFLVDSGGAYLPEQDEVFPDQDHFGGTFYRQPRLSSAGIPQISVVLGGCTAGGAYIPALSDDVVIVKGIGRIYLGGPPIVKAALNEIVEPDELGGADVHARQSGVADYLVYEEREAYEKVRDIVYHLNRPRACYQDRKPPCDPLYPIGELTGIINKNPKLPYETTEVIARLIDGSDFHEFKPLYGENLVCGMAHIHGYPIGILANRGILFSESAKKGAHFIEMCNQRNTPLLFLQNTTGYMVGREAEAGGIAKDGAKMVAAVACSTVPKFTVFIGDAYGAGNYGMCGRSMRPRFLFTWPNAKTATMGGDTAAIVMSDVARAGMRSSEVTEKHVEEIRNKMLAQYEEQSDAYYATARLWDDGIIEPDQTRDTLGLVLSIAAMQPPQQGNYRVFRM
jgi:3-methylcrotonyl-CoA carboxylase beta subunit